jgi:hypothetical protein
MKILSFAFLAVISPCLLPAVLPAQATQPAMLPGRPSPDAPIPVSPERAKMAKEFFASLSRGPENAVEIAGSIVDQYGQPVDGAQMTVERGVLLLASDAPAPKPSYESSTLSKGFNLIADLSRSIWTEERYVSIRFHRDGYYDGGFNLDHQSLSERSDSLFASPYSKYVAGNGPGTGLQILLQKIEHPAALTPLFAHGFASLYLYPDGTVVYGDPDNPDKRERVPPESVPRGAFRLTQYGAPKGQLAWAIQPFYFPQGGQRPVATNLSLTTGDPDILFRRADVLDVRKPCRSMGQAPTEGYSRSLPIDDHYFVDKCGGVSQFNYFYIKIHGKYGRGILWGGIDTIGKSNVGIAIVVWMQPNGSRDLEDGKDDIGQP